MNIKHSIIMIVTLGVLYSCNNSNTQDKSPLASSNWLLGEWRNSSANGVYIETWKQQNDSLFTAESYYIINKDTPSAETVRLEQHGTDLFYIPTVQDQNDNKPVSFKLSTSSEDQLVFENPEHDFPQTIVYKRINADSMVASIMGPREGKVDTIYFPMGRSK